MPDTPNPAAASMGAYWDAFANAISEKFEDEAVVVRTVDGRTHHGQVMADGADWLHLSRTEWRGGSDDGYRDRLDHEVQIALPAIVSIERAQATLERVVDDRIDAALAGPHGEAIRQRADDLITQWRHDATKDGEMDPVKARWQAWYEVDVEGYAAKVY